MIVKRRFWKAATVAPDEGGFAVLLDERTVRTPAGAALAAPTRALAEAAAAEWDAVEGPVEPTKMPVTRSLNSAIDRVARQRTEVAEVVAAYAGSDLLCYRADNPQALADRQSAAWDPLLAWVEERHGARLTLTAGVMHVAQPAEAVAALTRAVEAFDAFALTALHELTALSGSLVIALAVAEGRIGPDEGWSASRIDEDWQAELWGRDAEAEAAAAVKEADFAAAARFLDLLKD